MIQQGPLARRFNISHVSLLGILFAMLLSLNGCDDGGGSNSAYISDLQSENESLRSENDQLTREVHKDGYFVIATWIAVPSCFALFCAGFACGMKIKKSVLGR